MRRPRVFTPYDRERLVLKAMALIEKEGLSKPREVEKILTGDDTTRIELLNRAMNKAVAKAIDKKTAETKSAAEKLNSYQIAAVSQAGTYTSFLERLLGYIPTDIIAALWAILGVSSTLRTDVRAIVVWIAFPVFIGITFFWVFFGAQEVRTDKIPYAFFQSWVSAFALAVAGLVLSGDEIVGWFLPWDYAYGSILLIFSVVLIGVAESARDWCLKVYDTYMAKKESGNNGGQAVV
jgi:hypothetical protein